MPNCVTNFLEDLRIGILNTITGQVLLISTQLALCLTRTLHGLTLVSGVPLETGSVPISMVWNPNATSGH